MVLLRVSARERKERAKSAQIAGSREKKKRRKQEALPICEKVVFSKAERVTGWECIAGRNSREGRGRKRGFLMIK